MAAGNGFLTASPDARYGDIEGLFNATEIWAHKFTCPGSGDIDISEIGLYTYCEFGSSYLHLAIFTHDSSNNCPAEIVTNSDTGAVAIPVTTMAKCYYTYSTKPRITGGSNYWLASTQNNNNRYSRFATGTGPLYVSTMTYPTWPTDTQWHTHTDLSRDPSLYAVYEQVGGYILGQNRSTTMIGSW